MPLHRLLLLAGFCAVALAQGSSPAAAQQSASLNGYVRDAETGETLLQANVVIQGTTRGVATNKKG
jgi:hypothetical protein